MTELKVSVTIVIEPDGENRFHAFCPAFKGLHVDGTTEQEAFENAMEAVHVYLDSLERHGDPLPIGPHFQLERPKLSKRAIVRDATLSWPTHQTSGVS